MDWNKTEKEGEKEREKVIQQLSVTFVGSLYILNSDLHIQLNWNSSTSYEQSEIIRNYLKFRKYLRLIFTTKIHWDIWVIIVSVKIVKI